MATSIRTRRALELFATLLIGDGLISLLRPVRHSLLWWMPVPGVRGLMEWCAERPHATRAIGLAQVAAGLWLDARQYSSGPKRE
ncbi:hypothetical protein DAETH_11310 [Deinococcus aetherius]|uniref:Uncharacterized protein n=1 Tax=Deinococcus aetherius TaxID=200252 RepID=A0ABN6RCQ9_9DEIO|nr:hypothetical protein [Deinococcus aetherius]BDP41162.1 hypothetical protein DAETH_11310 [Deinococcus aetherius]